MKNICLYFLLLSFLLQSCYTYRKFDINDTYLKIGKLYKIKIEKKIILGKLLSFDENNLTVKNGNKEIQITRSEIQSIKLKEFSARKTTALVTPLALITMLTILFQNLHLPLGN